MKIKTKKKITKKTAKKPAKRKATKKVSKKKTARNTAPQKPSPRKPIGVVTHFYNAIKVAIVKFKKPVKTGVKLQFKGATTDFSETVKSMQYDHKPVAIAPKSKLIGIKVGKRVREGDKVFAV